MKPESDKTEANFDSLLQNNFSALNNSDVKQIISWGYSGEENNNEAFKILDSSFPKYRWENFNINDKKEYFIWEIPGNFKSLLQNYGFEFHSKQQSSQYDKLYSILEEYYNFDNVDIIFNEVALETACFFVTECKRGNCRPNRYMYGVDYISRSSNQGEPVINLDMYITDQFTFKFMTNLYKRLKSINDIFSVKNFGDINRLTPFLNSIGLGGFIVIKKGEKNIFLFAQLNQNINHSELCHFSYEKTFMPIDMENHEDGLTPFQRCLFRALDKDNGITLDALDIPIDYGICDFGIIYNERFEFEICSYVVINVNDDFILEELKDRYLTLANERLSRTLDMYSIDADNFSNFSKTYKATPESIKIFHLLDKRLKIKSDKYKKSLKACLPTEYRIDNPQYSEEIIKVFISYSWDDEAHKKWVLSLANNLTKNGVYVFLDQYDLNAGKDMTQFMESSVREADKVLLIMTPNFKNKAEKRESGVGYEVSIITSEIFNNQKTDKFIPIVKKGKREECVPSFIRSRIDIDMSNDSSFDAAFEELLRTIYNKPKVARPPIGKKPLL